MVMTVKTLFRRCCSKQLSFWRKVITDTDFGLCLMRNLLSSGRAVWSDVSQATAVTSRTTGSAVTGMTRADKLIWGRRGTGARLVRSSRAICLHWYDSYCSLRPPSAAPILVCVSASDLAALPIIRFGNTNHFFAASARKWREFRRVEATWWQGIELVNKHSLIEKA